MSALLYVLSIHIYGYTMLVTIYTHVYSCVIEVSVMDTGYIGGFYVSVRSPGVSDSEDRAVCSYFV